MLPAQLSSINENHLHDLVAGDVRESRSIEFKAKLVEGTDSEKKEFLADVSALANCGGGDLIFGIEEDQGVAAAVVGLASFDPDRDGLRIESILRDGIAPRIVGIRVQPVALSDGRTAIIVRVPNSLHRPHMVVFKQGSRFYSRNSAGKYQLDVHELRSAFIASESVADRIRQFRIERIDAILQGNTPETLSGKSYVCIHMIPVAAYDPSFSFDIARVRELLLLIGRQVCNPSVNFDGRLFSVPVYTGVADAYVQLFRNGVIEAVDCQMTDKYLPVAYESEIIKSVSDYAEFYRNHEMLTPVLVGLTLLNVKEFRMGKDRVEHHIGRPIDRDHLILPERFAESLDFDAASFLRPCFDQIWNACGYSRSMNYNEKGKWTSGR